MINEQRQRVVNVARSWLSTPYHTGARIKGRNGGIDCLTLLAEVFAEAGLVEKVAIPHYPPDWHLHRDAERYLEGLLKYTREIQGLPQPGDIALWKFGRCFSHGAIVTQWPQVIHAYVNSSVRFENAETARWLMFIGEGRERGKPRPIRFFSYWG
jgi:cell wall-associated NlpC family hydrolase